MKSGVKVGKKREAVEEAPVNKKIKFTTDEDDSQPAEVKETVPAVTSDAGADPSAKAPKKKRKNKGAAKKMKKKEERLKLEAKLKEERIASGGPEKLPTPREQAAQYLQQWSTDRTAWKFQKSRQLWILRHLLDTWNISDDNFKIALKYCKDLPEGNARTVTLAEMKEVIVKGVTATKTDDANEDEEEGEKPAAKAETEEKKDAGNEKEEKKKKKKKVKSDKGDGTSKSNKITQEMYDRAWKLVKALEKKEKEKKEQ
ncbi:hypothetical protein HDU79_006267 [Rhizoclosmatium sp. JEL0117]|nr:hypothetical protein HDU79_006267 [Rhizoclosmatium sp. JEL0117]